MAASGTRSPQLKFVERDAQGLPVKRKQVHQACFYCRKRKVRDVVNRETPCRGSFASPTTLHTILRLTFELKETM